MDHKEDCDCQSCMAKELGLTNAEMERYIAMEKRIKKIGIKPKRSDYGMEDKD